MVLDLLALMIILSYRSKIFDCKGPKNLGKYKIIDLVSEIFPQPKSDIIVLWFMFCALLYRFL